jgi:hypothetical protein
MNRFFGGAAALGFTLAVLGLGLSVAAAALGPRSPDLPAPRYFGDEHAAAQRDLQARPAAEMPATF